MASSSNQQSSKRVRVLVCDDSAFMRTAISRMIQSDPELVVIDTARDGVEALEKATRLDPDVMTLDIEMPRMDGLTVLRKIMAERPRPVIMLSSLTQDGAHATIEALSLGAFDFIPKQSSFVSLDIVKIREDLVAKIKAAAHSRLHTHKKVAPFTPPASAVKPSSLPVGVTPSVVALGISTGGPKALQEVLPALPADLPVGLLIVQHMPAAFTGPFAQRLNSLSKVEVREARDEDLIEPGTVLIAPGGWHLTAYRRTLSRYAVHISKIPANTLHIPSADVLMLSVAEVYGAQAMGVVMTGMGADGSLGMKAIYEKGGMTLGQDEASCAVYGMPRSCAEMGILRRVTPLSQVAEEITHAVCRPAVQILRPVTR
jgi:two-component system chemotaxis response regulator CheB